MLILLLILVAVPIVEIYLFIEIGGAIGVGRTIGIVIITAVIGGYMLRREGRAVLRELSDKLSQGADEGDNISETLVQGVLVLLAGALLLTPGFLTDILGFAMILPWSRKRIGSVIVQYLITHFKDNIRSGHFFYRSSHSSSPPDDIIDVEYEETPEPSPEPSQTPNDGDPHDKK